MNKIDVINKIRQSMVDCEDAHPSVDVEDQAIVQRILQELQLKIGDEYEPFRNIEELGQYDIPGAGPIVAKYIRSLKSQMARSSLLHHLLGSRAHRCARVKNCTALVWQLFLDFLSSDAYFDGSILNVYDNAFARLKPREYSAELFELSKNPYIYLIACRQQWICWRVGGSLIFREFYWTISCIHRELQNIYPNIP